MPDKQILHSQSEGSAAAAAGVHPEELRASVIASIGPSRLEATARCTPAGLVCVGVMVSCILLSVAAVIAAARRPSV